MNKKLNRKLNLSRETVADLDRSDLRRGVAGVLTPFGCVPSVGPLLCITQSENPTCRCGPVE